MTGRIVLLNGIGSAGKSSIARALQAITRERYLHVQMDAFLEMLPQASFGQPDGLTFETGEQDGHKVVAIQSGPTVVRAMRGMRHAVAAMAAQGNNLILDEVLIGGEFAEYSTLLAGFTLHAVGIFAPLEVLEARERRRGDRLIGLARGQFGCVHRGMRYDLEIDSSAAPPEDCAERIRRAFDL